MNRILLYIPRWYPSIGGMETHVSNLVINSKNYLFRIATNAVPGYPTSERFNERTAIQRIGPDDRNFTPIGRGIVHKMTFPYRHALDKARLNNTHDYIHRSKCDLLHLHYPYIPHTFGKLAVMREKPVLKERLVFRSKRPTLLTIHGLLSKLNNKPVYSDYEDFIIKNYKNIICVDKIIYSYVNSLPDSDNRRVWFIPNSLDIHKFTSSPMVSREKITLGFIGRLERSRGLDNLEELIMNKPEFIKLKIIGSGNHETIAEFTRKYKGPDIEISANVPNDQIPQTLKEIDLLFNPVLAEGISRISLEAMACGRPVMMLDKGDRYPVIHGDNGYLMKPQISEILSTLDAINADREKLGKMGVSARTAVEKEFSNEVVIPRIEEVYRQIMEAS